MSDDRFGPYVLEELIGRGGMGEVYRAHDTRRDRVVALKRLTPDSTGDPDFLARFRRESGLVARLREPHVIPIHDFGEIDGRLYIDMRLVEGVDLSTVLKSDGPMDPARAVRIIGQVARALDAAHRDGVVHRDVKPSNVLLDRNDHRADSEDDFVYLIDFGIARRIGAAQVTQLTMTGSVVGTPAYMAPERINGDGEDHRADVYALGCLLYEMLTATPPFQGNLLSLVNAHLNHPPPVLSRQRPGLPAGLDAVVAQGLAKSPEQRFQRAGDLAQAARRALTSPVSAPGWVDPRGPAGTRGAPGPSAPSWLGPTQQPFAQQPRRTPQPMAQYPPVPPPLVPPRRRPVAALVATGAAVVVVAALVGLVLWLNQSDGRSQPGGAVAASTTPSASSSAAPATTVSGVGTEFVDAQGRFALRVPQGWEVDTTGQRGTAAIMLDPDPVSTSAGPFRVNLNVIVSDFDGNLDDLLARTRTELTGGLTDYRTTLDEELTLSDGTPAHLIGGTFVGDDSGSTLQNLQLYALDAGKAVAVTGTAPAEAWESYAAELDAAVRSVTLTT